MRRLVQKHWRSLSLTFRVQPVLDGFWEVCEDNGCTEIRFYTLIIYEYCKGSATLVTDFVERVSASHHLSSISLR